jgi:hypothetical protein
MTAAGEVNWPMGPFTVYSVTDDMSCDVMIGLLIYILGERLEGEVFRDDLFNRIKRDPTMQGAIQRMLGHVGSFVDGTFQFMVNRRFLVINSPGMYAPTQLLRSTVAQARDRRH